MYKAEDESLIPAKVNISTICKTIIAIDERNHKIELKFEIGLEWYEVRAKYFNLKTITAQNALDPSEVDKLWIPYVVFLVRYTYKTIDSIFGSYLVFSL